MLKPSKGRIVLYCFDEETQAPAIVTRVGDDGTTVELAVFERRRVVYRWDVYYSETIRIGTWTWPPKTKEFV